MQLTLGRWQHLLQVSLPIVLLAERLVLVLL